VTNEQDFHSIELMETLQSSFDYIKRENRMGEARKDALRLNFDRRRRTAACKNTIYELKREIST
jgi:hypothetical protein